MSNSTLADRRLGIVRIPLPLINADPQSVRLVMSRLIVVEAKFTIQNDRIEYIALCDDFAPVPVGNAIGMYDAELTRGADGTTAFKGWRSRGVPQ